MSKEKFKLFVKNNPLIGKDVMNGNVSFQSLYEYYVMYGEDSDYFSKYKEKEEISPETTLKEVFSTIKNVDLSTIQNGIVNLQKTIGLLQDLGVGNSSDKEISTYEARPIYKYFED